MQHRTELKGLMRMITPIYVVCATCRDALALEWDPSAFLVNDPLEGGR
jgi:hypothetical protein